jgi:hypothetical protein
MLHPSVFYHAQREIWVRVHVDDFRCIGKEQYLDLMHAEGKKLCELKVRNASISQVRSQEGTFSTRTSIGLTTAL